MVNLERRSTRFGYRDPTAKAVFRAPPGKDAAENSGRVPRAYITTRIRAANARTTQGLGTQVPARTSPSQSLLRWLRFSISSLGQAPCFAADRGREAAQ